MKNKALKSEEIFQLLESGSWPHLRDGQKWKKSSDSLKHLYRMAKKLCGMGMPLEEVILMMSDLYWCAYGDIQDMPKPKSRDEGPKNKILYFDKFEIMFRMSVADITAEELARDYEFYSNLYVSRSTIWWTHGLGGASGGPLHNFLSVVRLDNNYAFGPTRKQRGWPTERLAEVDAVGVYKRKEPPVKLGRRSGSEKRVAKSRRKSK
jgi:hypothetical protein